MLPTGPSRFIGSFRLWCRMAWMSRPADCGRSGWCALNTVFPSTNSRTGPTASACRPDACGRVRGALRFQITGRSSSPQSSRLQSERPSSVWRGRAALYQRALAIDETALGPDHPGTAFTTWRCSIQTRAATARPSRSTNGLSLFAKKALVHTTPEPSPSSTTTRSCSARPTA